jgi:hypothetical protein
MNWMLSLEALSTIAGAAILFLIVCAIWNRKQGWRKRRVSDPGFQYAAPPHVVNGGSSDDSKPDATAYVAQDLVIAGCTEAPTRQ